MNRPRCNITRKYLAQIVVAALTLFSTAAESFASEDLSNPDVAVEAGREALEASWGLPWYDAETDAYHPVDLPVPRQPSSFWKWLKSLFTGWNLDLADVLTFLGWLVVAGLLTWIIVALIRAYQSAELTTAAEATTRYNAKAHIARIEALPIAVDESVGDFLNAARRAYESGDLTRAIVYLFSFELLELDRSALLRLVKGKTNRQYLRELRRGGEPTGRLAEILRRTVGVFEAAFFGAHPPSQSDFDDCWQEASELQRLLGPAEEGA